MTKWNETDEAAAFIASGDSRNTHPRIMKAIAFFARNADEAERIWNGDFGSRVDVLSIWENATCNGLKDAADMPWGETTLAKALEEEGAL